MLQALLQMDAATKWGQSKSNSMVFNTFIFMQARDSFSHASNRHEGTRWCVK